MEGHTSLLYLAISSICAGETVLPFHSCGSLGSSMTRWPRIVPSARYDERSTLRKRSTRRFHLSRLNPFSSRLYCEFPVKLMTTRALARRAFSRSKSRHDVSVEVIWVPVYGPPNFDGGTWVGPKA